MFLLLPGACVLVLATCDVRRYLHGAILSCLLRSLSFGGGWVCVGVCACVCVCVCVRVCVCVKDREGVEVCANLKPPMCETLAKE